MRRETCVERLFAKHVKPGPSADEAIRYDAIVSLVNGKLVFFNGAPPNLSGKLRDSSIRPAFIENLALVNDGHVGAKIHHVFDDVCGENDDDAFADFREQVIETVAL